MAEYSTKEFKNDLQNICKVMVKFMEQHRVYGIAIRQNGKGGFEFYFQSSLQGANQWTFKNDQ